VPADQLISTEVVVDASAAGVRACRIFNAASLFASLNEDSVVLGVPPHACKSIEIALPRTKNVVLWNFIGGHCTS
jgi:hypothetical protein